jgi:hypothetical protein
MGADILHALLALAVLCMPLLFAWLVLTRTARRHKHPKPPDRPMR